MPELRRPAHAAPCLPELPHVRRPRGRRARLGRRRV